MTMDEMPGDVEVPPTRLYSNPTPEEYALALVAALELAARVGGRKAFDSLFSRGFDRTYAWSYLRVGRNAERAQALTMRILLGAARSLAQHEAAADRGSRLVKEPRVSPGVSRRENVRSIASTGIETGGTRGGKIAKRLGKRLGAVAILIAVAAIAPARADAHHGGYGHGWHGRPWHTGYHGRWHGGWGYPPYLYGSPPAFYFPPPVVYAPPPPVYAPPPPPVVYLPPPPSINFEFSWPHR